MNTNRTELVFILDRSGSMSGLESDTIGGYNAMLEKQQQEYGEAIVTTVLFDDQYEVLHDRIDMHAVAAITEKEYYVNMMIAWYFATALAKQYDASLPFIQEHRLEPWTHNKAIQKAIESYRISDEQKAYLRSLKGKLPKQS